MVTGHLCVIWVIFFLQLGQSLLDALSLPSGFFSWLSSVFWSLLFLFVGMSGTLMRSWDTRRRQIAMNVQTFLI